MSGFASWIQSPPQHEKVLFGGIIGSWFSLLQFLATPFIGAASDVAGRKLPLLLCLLGITFSYALWAAAHSSFLLFCVSRTIGGLCKGNISLSTAIVTDVSDERSRGKGMALIGIAFSVGFIVGPMMGALLSNMRHSFASSDFFAVPALVALSLSFANVLFTALLFRESLPPQHRVRTGAAAHRCSPSAHAHSPAAQAESLGTGLRQAVDFVNPSALFSFRSVSGITSKGTSPSSGVRGGGGCRSQADVR